MQSMSILKKRLSLTMVCCFLASLRVDKTRITHAIEMEGRHHLCAGS